MRQRTRELRGCKELRARNLRYEQKGSEGWPQPTGDKRQRFQAYSKHGSLAQVCNILKSCALVLDFCRTHCVEQRQRGVRVCEYQGRTKHRGRSIVQKLKYATKVLGDGMNVYTKLTYDTEAIALMLIFTYYGLFPAL